jgi:hypothetical protein
MGKNTLRVVANEEEILASLRAFNRDRPKPSDLARDVMRRTSYWVFDRSSRAFGPSKFVGYAGMTHDLYSEARTGRTTGAKFDGTVARLAIEAQVGEFKAVSSLPGDLKTWAEALVGDDVFVGIDVGKWWFVQVGKASKPVLNPKEWDWRPLTGEEIKKVPVKEGAYIVRAKNEYSKVQVMRRCVGEDEHGILDVGESQNLRQRLGALLNCMCDATQTGHMAGWRYAYLGMNELFPLDRLEFAYQTTKDKDAAYALEGKILEAYVRRHYELPPLNYKFNWSGFETR